MNNLFSFGKKVLCKINNEVILKGVAQNSSFVDSVWFVVIIEAPIQHENLIGTTLRIKENMIILEDHFNSTLKLVKKECWLGNTRVFLNLSKQEYEQLAFTLSEYFKNTSKDEEKAPIDEYRIEFEHGNIPNFKELSNSITNFLKLSNTEFSSPILQLSTSVSQENVEDTDTADLFLTIYIICALEDKMLPSWSVPNRILNLFSSNIEKRQLRNFFEKLPVSFETNNTAIEKLNNLWIMLLEYLDIPEDTIPTLKPQTLSNYAKMFKVALLYNITGKYKTLASRYLESVTSGRSREIHPLVVAYQRTFNLQPYITTTFDTSAISRFDIKKPDEWSAARIQAQHLINTFLQTPFENGFIDYAFQADESTRSNPLAAFLLVCFWASLKETSPYKRVFSETTVYHPSPIPNDILELKPIGKQSQTYHRPSVSTLNDQYLALSTFSTQQKKLEPLFSDSELPYQLGPILSHLICEIIPENLIDPLILHWALNQHDRFISFESWSKHTNLRSDYSEEEKMRAFYDDNLANKATHVLTFVNGVLSKDRVKSTYFNSYDDYYDEYVENASSDTIHVFLLTRHAPHFCVTPNVPTISSRKISLATAVPVFATKSLRTPSASRRRDPSLIELKVTDDLLSMLKPTTMAHLLFSMWSLEYNKKYKLDVTSSKTHVAFQDNVAILVKWRDVSFWLVRCRGFTLKNVEPLLGFYLLMNPTLVAYPMLSLMSYDAWKNLGEVEHLISHEINPLRRYWVFGNRFIPGTPAYEDPDAYFALTKHIFYDLIEPDLPVMDTKGCVNYTNIFEDMQIMATHVNYTRYLLKETDRINTEGIEFMKNILTPLSKPSTLPVNLAFQHIASDKLIFYLLYRKESPNVAIPSFIGYPYIFVHALRNHADRVFSWKPSTSFQVYNNKVAYGPHTIMMDQIPAVRKKLYNMYTGDSTSLYTQFDLFFDQEHNTLDSEGDTSVPPTHPFVFNQHDLHLLLWHYHVSSTPQRWPGLGHQPPLHEKSVDLLVKYYGEYLPSEQHLVIPVDQYVSTPSNNYTQYTTHPELIIPSSSDISSESTIASSSDTPFESTSASSSSAHLGYSRYITGNLDFISKRNLIQEKPELVAPEVILGYNQMTDITKPEFVFEKRTLNWKIIYPNRGLEKSMGILTGQVQAIKMIFNSAPPKLDPATLYKIDLFTWFQFVESVEKTSISTGKKYYEVFGYEINASVYGNTNRYVRYTSKKTEATAIFIPLQDVLLVDYPGLRYWILMPIAGKNLPSSDIVVFKPSLSDFKRQVAIMPNFYALPVKQ